MYVNNDIVLRYEFFGGLLFNKFNLEKYELDHENTTFIWALKKTKNKEASIKITKSVHKLNNFIPDLTSMVNEKIIINSNDNYISDETLNNLTSEAVLLTEASKKRNYLSAPLELTIYPSYHCQLNCKFCFINNKNNYKVKSFEKWITLIEEAKKNGCYDCIDIRW